MGAPGPQGDDITSHAVRLLLLQQAEAGNRDADLPTDVPDLAAVLCHDSRAARDTAEALAARLGDDAAAPVRVTAALRGPDLFLGGERVTLAGSADELAAATTAVSPDDVLEVPFFREQLDLPDSDARVGAWVAHLSPPGDDAAAVERRVESFAWSLQDASAWRGRTVVAVAPSPVLRAVGLALRGEDPGEHEPLTGYAYTVGPESLDVVETGTR